MPDVYVGVGSNVEPAEHLRLGVERLGAHYGPLICSIAYRSPAFGFDGPDFLNMVVRLRSDAGPASVAAALADIERVAGRKDRDRTRSRTLDLDLLLYGASVDAALRLPRVDVLSYPFVLGPLSDIAPDLRHPVTGIVVAEAWKAMAGREHIELEPVPDAVAC